PRRIFIRCISSRSGGIGRRAWFRSMYPQGCGGSSPFFGTNHLVATRQTALTVSNLITFSCPAGSGLGAWAASPSSRISGCRFAANLFLEQVFLFQKLSWILVYFFAPAAIPN